MNGRIQYPTAPAAITNEDTLKGLSFFLSIYGKFIFSPTVAELLLVSLLSNQCLKKIAPRVVADEINAIIIDVIFSISLNVITIWEKYSVLPYN